MKARWAETILRFLVLANYASLPLLLFVIEIGRRLGWNAPLIALLVAVAAVFTLTFIRVHLATGAWKLTHTWGSRLDEAGLRRARSALALGFGWFVVLCLSTAYAKLYITFNRLTALDFLAYVYLAGTLPSSVLAWRGSGAASIRDSLVKTGLRVLLGAVICAALFLLNLWVIRPWQHTWGATAEEASRPMPGDELVAQADMNATRAVTVQAPADEVWPWIVQLGYKRAGFYSLDYLDNDSIPSARRIIEEYQNLAAGDLVPIGEGCNMRVVSLERNSSLVFQFADEPWAGTSWVFGLYPEAAGETRLVSRLRVRYDRGFPHIMPWLFIDTFEIIMMRQCLLGIKERAESHPGSAV